MDQTKKEILQVLSELIKLKKDLRFGQLVTTVSSFANKQAAVIDDHEFLASAKRLLEQFRQSSQSNDDLAR